MLSIKCTQANRAALLMGRSSGFHPAMTAVSMRSFSAVKPPSTTAANETAASDSSIFASADYFKDVKVDEDVLSAETSGLIETKEQLFEKVDEIMWMDANDSLATTMALAPKDVDNLIQGIQTYGFSESIIYYESLIWDLWMFFAETQGMGMGAGLIATSIVTRLIFAPVMIYSVSEK